MNKAPHYSQVLESVRSNGQILPVYTFNGGILDGLQRQMAALECGLQPHFRELSAREAPVVLFSLHPERAVAQFGEGLFLTQQCELFSARPAQVLAARRAIAPPAEPPKKWPRNYRTGKQTITLPGSLKVDLVTLSAELRCSQQDVLVCALRNALRDVPALRSQLIAQRIAGNTTQRGKRRA